MIVLLANVQSFAMTVSGEAGGALGYSSNPGDRSSPPMGNPEGTSLLQYNGNYRLLWGEKKVSTLSLLMDANGEKYLASGFGSWMDVSLAPELKFWTAEASEEHKITFKGTRTFRLSSGLGALTPKFSEMLRYSFKKTPFVSLAYGPTAKLKHYSYLGSTRSDWSFDILMFLRYKVLEDAEIEGSLGWTHLKSNDARNSYRGPTFSVSFSHDWSESWHFYFLNQIMIRRFVFYRDIDTLWSLTGELSKDLTDDLLIRIEINNTNNYSTYIYSEYKEFTAALGLSYSF